MESTTASSPLSSRIPGPTNIAVFHRSDDLETLQLGPISIRVLEDGSRTENRLGVVTLGLAPFSTGPPQHWHEMHDETFLVTKGRVRFTTTTYAEEEGLEKGVMREIDVGVGGLVVVPPRARHTFSNPFAEEAELFNTFSPGFYVNYLRMMAKEWEEKKEMSVERNAEIMKRFATLVVQDKEKKQWQDA
jgi:mannose-6-phosphate isomerase-like protein (cupin superfamily)